MTHITIDTKTKQAQKFIELIATLPFAKILEEHPSPVKKVRAQGPQSSGHTDPSYFDALPDWQVDVKKIRKDNTIKRTKGWL